MISVVGKTEVRVIIHVTDCLTCAFQWNEQHDVGWHHAPLGSMVVRLLHYKNANLLMLLYSETDSYRNERRSKWRDSGSLNCDLAPYLVRATEHVIVKMRQILFTM